MQHMDIRGDGGDHSAGGPGFFFGDMNKRTGERPCAGWWSGPVNQEGNLFDASDRNVSFVKQKRNWGERANRKRR